TCYMHDFRPRTQIFADHSGGDRNCILLSKSNKGNGVAPPPHSNWSLLEPTPTKLSAQSVSDLYVSASVRIGCYSTRSTLNFAGDSCRTNSNPFASLPMPITVFGSIGNCFSSVVFVFQ